MVLAFVASNLWAFVASAFLFGTVSFANVPPIQARVMKYGAVAPVHAAATKTIFFNVANAMGGVIGGTVIDS
ncbi:MAG: hypothetical protein P8O97_03280 [Gammaproteobacteria bacterium]|nr:hypothetical protein [Gammaproteobacteria bacterium]